MSFDSRHHSKAYRLSWGHGRALLRITSKSWVQNPQWSANPMYFQLSMQDRGWISTGPDEYAYNLISPYLQRSWIDSLRGFLIPERTASWSSIAAFLLSHPHLPIDAHSIIMHRIREEACEAARMAAFLEHCLMWIAVDLMVTTDYTNGAIEEWEEIDTDGEEFILGDDDEEDDDDDEEYEDEDDDMEEVENRGLTQEEIEQHVMVARFLVPGPVEVCAICLDEVTRGFMAGWLPCSHVFHPQCIATWLSRRGDCPLCRGVVLAC